MFKSAVTSFSPSWRFISKFHSSHLFSLWNLFSLQNMVWFFCSVSKGSTQHCYAHWLSLVPRQHEVIVGFQKDPLVSERDESSHGSAAGVACPRCMWYRGAVPARSGCGLINLSICYLGRRLAAEWRESLRSLGSPSCQAVRGPWCGARIWSNSGGIGVAGSIHPCNGECWGGGEKHLENKVRSGAVSFPFKRRSLRLGKQPVKSENVVCVCLIWAKEIIRVNNREHWALSLQGRGEGSWSWWGGEAGAALLCEKWGFASEVVKGMLRRGNEWESKASVCGRNAGAPP